MPNARKTCRVPRIHGPALPPRTGTASFHAMHLTHALHRRAVLTVKPAAERHVRTASVATRDDASGHAFAEIHAYIAIRDRLLQKAESVCTESNIERAAGANEFVEKCLRPARSPYEAQHLPETEAARERKRCEAVRLRLARLRSTVADAA